MSMIHVGQESECVLEVPVDAMHGLSYQQLVVRQPIKMGGMGLRSLVQIRSAAFVGSVELGTSAGLCPEPIYMPEFPKRGSGALEIER